ncbi:MAG: TetR/AcrR family transcriptional regulator [Azospirillaceae bacterium]|nr:TetR/AcrR family transcriptional regulator [Azospirillaceae bacterium]
MARPKSDDRRSAILAAAVRVIAAQGPGATTALIAKEAGVSNGSLFTYFETKADLLNQLYREVKAEMAAAALDGLPDGDDVRAQLFHMWSHWLRWAVASPEKRRVLAHLDVSGEITPDSRQAGRQMMAGIAAVLEHSRANGPMRAVPLGFIVALMQSMANTTMDFMIQEPANADTHCATAFDAMWRMVG